MTSISGNAPVLVLGGTGKTGRRIVGRLEEKNVAVRVGARSTGFDWNDRASWAPMLDGARAAYVSYSPDLAVPGAPETVEAFAETALEHGIRRLVLLSGRGEEEAERSEDIVKASGADWTILRASWFMQNFSEDFLLEPILAGHLALPVGDVVEPFIDAQDIADVAVAALTEDGHVGRLYELTGPRLLTFREAAAEIAAATGRDIRFETVGMDGFLATLRAADLPEDYLSLIRYLFAEVLDGRNASLAHGVEEALGRQPRDFSSYAADAAANGRWSPEASAA